MVNWWSNQSVYSYLQAPLLHTVQGTGGLLGTSGTLKGLAVMESCQYCQIYHTFSKDGIQGLGIVIMYKLNWSINWIHNVEMYFKGWTAGWFRWNSSSYCVTPSNAQAQQWKTGGGTGKGRLVICTHSTNWVQLLPPPSVHCWCDYLLRQVWVNPMHTNMLNGSWLLTALYVHMQVHTPHIQIQWQHCTVFCTSVHMAE